MGVEKPAANVANGAGGWLVSVTGAGSDVACSGTDSFTPSGRREPSEPPWWQGHGSPMQGTDDSWWPIIGHTSPGEPSGTRCCAAMGDTEPISSTTATMMDVNLDMDTTTGCKPSASSSGAVSMAWRVETGRHPSDCSRRLEKIPGPRFAP